MRFGHSHQYATYILGDIRIDSVESYKDLGIHLKFHQHTSSTAAKANRTLGLIKKSFEFLDPDMLFKTLVRPIIEYGKHPTQGYLPCCKSSG